MGSEFVGSNLCNSNISQFYAGKNIFVSGATGFLGKVLVEKLLRDCASLNKIYILMRMKKGVSARERYEDYVHDKIFDRIRDSLPSQLTKLKLIKGDLTKEGLDLDQNDEIELSENLDVIFHCAANVTFEQTLKDSVNFNVNGTLLILQLAAKTRNLSVFVYISTAFSQCQVDVLEEKHYTAPYNPYGIIHLTSFLNDDILETFTRKILNGMPNTYVFSKALAEDLVYSFRNKFSIAIARPSIVTSAVLEPYPGWIEGISNGPTALIAGNGRGVLRTMYASPQHIVENIPVDITINAILNMAYKRSTMQTQDVFYCNITNSEVVPITLDQSFERFKEKTYENPFVYSMWYPNFSFKSNYYHNLVCVLIYQLLPAYFVDFCLILIRRRPFMLKAQQKIINLTHHFSYFLRRKWNFKNGNFIKLYDETSDFDKQIFNCNYGNVNIPQYIHDIVLGTRKYLMNESPETIPKAKENLKKLYLLDKITKTFFYGILFYTFWCCKGSLISFLMSLFQKLF